METQAVCYVGYMLKSFLVLTLPPMKGHRPLSIGSHLFSSHHEHQLTWSHLSNARCLYFSTISLYCLRHLTRDAKTQESIWSHCLSRQLQVLLLGPFDSFIVLVNSWDPLSQEHRRPSSTYKQNSHQCTQDSGFYGFYEPLALGTLSAFCKTQSSPSESGVATCFSLFST